MTELSLTKTVVFSVCVCLIIWQSYVCLERYLQFNLNTAVEFEKSSAVIFPVFTVCPAYPVAYNNTKLYNFGIAGRNRYRQGIWGHEHAVDEHEIFKHVTHDIEDIIKTVEMRFSNREPNIVFNKENMKSLEYREKYHEIYGRCFEVDIQSYGNEKSLIVFETNMPVYIFIKYPGVFYDNEKSRLEVILGKCLFIELIYEIYKKSMNAGCKQKQPGSCTCLDYDDLTYDDCTETALEKHLMEKLNCVVPFINSTNTVCKVKNIRKQVSSVPLVNLQHIKIILNSGSI